METYCAPVEHTFAPVCDRASRILILGTFPSVKSRENAFYYGHPQNRFWKVMAGVTGEAVPDTIEEKTALLLSHGIALWDVIRSSVKAAGGMLAQDFGREMKKHGHKKKEKSGGGHVRRGGFLRSRLAVKGAGL